MIKTAIIIVNYKTPWHLKACLKSVFKYTQDFVVIVVHNSQDAQSLEVGKTFEKKYPGRVKNIYNKENLGLVGGVNSAYSEGMKYERVCFLNSDILVTKDWLKELNIVLDNHPNVVQVAPDVSHYYEGNILWKVVRWKVMKRFPALGSRLCKLLLNFDPPRSQEKNPAFRVADKFYQFCTGACNLVRTQYFKERRYFWDPNIIHGYGDELDMSYYLRQFGDIGVTNKSYVFHFLNITFDKLNPTQKVLKSKLQILNKFYVIDKWLGNIKNDISNLDTETLLHLQTNSPEIKTMLEYIGILEVNPDFSKYIKTIPAKQVWTDLRKE